jgi:hypothetical protein
MLNAFHPETTYTISAGASATSQQIKSKTGGEATVRIVVPSSGAMVYVAFGDSLVQASSSSMPVLPGTFEVFGLTPGETYISVLSSGATTNVYVTVGRGE